MIFASRQTNFEKIVAKILKICIIIFASKQDKEHENNNSIL